MNQYRDVRPLSRFHENRPGKQNLSRLFTLLLASERAEQRRIETSLRLSPWKNVEEFAGFEKAWNHRIR